MITPPQSRRSKNPGKSAGLIWSPSCRAGALAIRVDDFRSGGEPDLVVSGDVLQRPVEIANPVRRPDEEGMQRDAHHPRDAGAFVVKHVEGVADALMKVAD